MFNHLNAIMSKRKKKQIDLNLMKDTKKKREQFEIQFELSFKQGTEE